MTVWEGVSLCIVLLLALYGCAQAVVRGVRRMLKPQNPRLSLMLHLRKEDNPEQQIRFAEWLASEWCIPIEVDTSELNEEERRIATILLNQNYG